MGKQKQQELLELCSKNAFEKSLQIYNYTWLVKRRNLSGEKKNLLDYKYSVTFIESRNNNKWQIVIHTSYISSNNHKRSLMKLIRVLLKFLNLLSLFCQKLVE